MPNQPTWASQQSQSQIDEIWIKDTQLQNFYTPKVKDPIYITNSDHKIIHTAIHIPKIQKCTKNRTKRTIYKYDMMNTET